MVEDENLVYRSPSEMSNYLKLSEFNSEEFKENDSCELENLELPISNKVDILSPEGGSITRYANIFNEIDECSSEDDCLPDSYSDSFVYNSNLLKKSGRVYDGLCKNEADLESRSEKGLTFSDRVIKERQRMIRKKILSNLYLEGSRRVKSGSRVKPEKRFSLLKEEEVQVDEETNERYKRVEEVLKIQKDDIKDIRMGSLRSASKVVNEQFVVKEENSRLLEENERSFERIKSLQIELEDLQSELVVERKQNEQLLKDRIDLQNRLNFLSKENKSLTTSQEMMQNMHKNELEELKNKKVELSAKITKLENDLDYFRQNLQESHKMNEMLKAEVASINEMTKNDRMEIQKLKIENKRLMENNSIYKSQNYSLIEINDRLRNRTLFRNHSGELTTTNSSTVTNVSTINLQSNSSISQSSDSPTFITSNLPSLPPSLDSLSQNSAEKITLDTFSTKLYQDTSSKGTDLLSILNSSQNSPSSVFNGDLSPTNGGDTKVCLKVDTSGNWGNPTTKWVVDRVSRNSSVEALQSLREKIKNITADCNVENVNVTSSLKCFHSNVTINLIQNKLQLISQRLNETIV